MCIWLFKTLLLRDSGSYCDRCACQIGLRNMMCYLGRQIRPKRLEVEVSAVALEYPPRPNPAKTGVRRIRSDKKRRKKALRTLSRIKSSVQSFRFRSHTHDFFCPCSLFWIHPASPHSNLFPFNQSPPVDYDPSDDRKTCFFGVVKLFALCS